MHGVGKTNPLLHISVFHYLVSTYLLKRDNTIKVVEPHRSLDNGKFLGRA